MIAPEEMASFAARLPQMQHVEENLWRGMFLLHASFNGVTLEDVFEIEIALPPAYPKAIPTLKEVGGRTWAIAQKHNVRNIRDMHRNPDTGIACVCVKQEEAIRFPPGSTLNTFVEELAIPYLYGLASFDRNGRWPWEEYSHGALGLLEYIGRNGIASSPEAIRELVTPILQEPNAKEFARQLHRLAENRHCPCGERRPFRRCHTLAWRGLVQMRRAMNDLGLDAKALFPGVI
jgi:hypothetical protein